MCLDCGYSNPTYVSKKQQRTRLCGEVPLDLCCRKSTIKTNKSFQALENSYYFPATYERKD
ncbi:hypothetical protein AAZX31_17G119400 [Glycine max]